MTEWTARIDALLAEEPSASNVRYEELACLWFMRRLSLAAERLREPHKDGCEINLPIFSRSVDYYDNQIIYTGCCTCGKDDDMRRILEGNK